MMHRLRIAAHIAIGRVVMPDAPQCPTCGSRFLMIDRDAYGPHIDIVEKCVTCGSEWGEGSQDWDELHPALVVLGSIDMCPCCGIDYDYCDCTLILVSDKQAHCEDHDKVCEMPQESEANT